MCVVLLLLISNHHSVWCWPEPVVSAELTLVTQIADCSQNALTAGKARTVAYAEAVFDQYGNRMIVGPNVIDQIQLSSESGIEISGTNLSTWGNTGFALQTSSTKSQQYRIIISLQNQKRLAVYSRVTQVTTQSLIFCVNPSIIAWNKTQVGCPEKVVAGVVAVIEVAFFDIYENRLHDFRSNFTTKVNSSDLSPFGNTNNTMVIPFEVAGLAHISFLNKAVNLTCLVTVVPGLIATATISSMPTFTASDNITLSVAYLDAFNNTVSCGVADHPIVGVLSLQNDTYNISMLADNDCRFIFVQVTRAGKYSLTIQSGAFWQQHCCVDLLPSVVSPYSTHIYGSGLGMLEPGLTNGVVFAGLNYSVYIDARDNWYNVIHKPLRLNTGEGTSVFIKPQKYWFKKFHRIHQHEFICITGTL